jgi:hypothetical protein
MKEKKEREHPNGATRAQREARSGKNRYIRMGVFDSPQRGAHAQSRPKFKWSKKRRPLACRCRGFFSTPTHAGGGCRNGYMVSHTISTGGPVRGYAGRGGSPMPRKAGCCRAARSPRESGKGGKFQSWRDIGYKHTQPQKDAENGRIKGLSQRRRDRSNPTRGGAEGNALKINAILI